MMFIKKNNMIGALGSNLSEGLPERKYPPESFPEIYIYLQGLFFLFAPPIGSDVSQLAVGIATSLLRQDTHHQQDEGCCDWSCVFVHTANVFYTGFFLEMMVAVAACFFNHSNIHLGLDHYTLTSLEVALVLEYLPSNRG